MWKLNRLSRKSLDLLNIIEVLKTNNISFRSCTEKYETETPAGELQFHILVNKRELDMLFKKTEIELEFIDEVLLVNIYIKRIGIQSYQDIQLHFVWNL